MLNNFVLIGKIKKITLTTRDTYTMTLTAPDNPTTPTTPQPNPNIFTIELPHNIGKNVEYYTKEGDTIGVKGYLKPQENNTLLVADRVTFLQTKNNPQLNKGEI